MSTMAEAMAKIAEINRVEGFDAGEFAVEYTDMETGETRKRLPVVVQIAWFRLKYPDGKIAVSAVPEDGGFTASAKIYANYRDSAECYLAEAQAWRGPDEAKPGVSSREWSQTAAIGIALRNAGFGLQVDATESGDRASSAPETQTAKVYAHILDEDRKINAQKFEAAFYSNPDMRQIEAQSAKKSLPPATADLGGAHTSTAGAARTGQHSGTAIERSGTGYHRIIRVKSY